MFCTCRHKRKASMPNHATSVDSPLQIRLIKSLGLHSFMLEKFVFRRKPQSYSIRKMEGKNALFIGERLYEPPDFYRLECDIIEIGKHSVPVARLTPTMHTSEERLPTVIYAHGNSSDMGDALKFMTCFASKFRAEYVVFDYTGYGQSRETSVGEEVICWDMQYVLAWVNRPLQSIVLWGFSLGSYPIVVNAAKYKVGGVVLQCPIGSLSCMFYEQYQTKVRFKDDHFANIDHIDKITSPLLMMHSTEDEIIPIEQARLLYNKYTARNGTKNIQFLEVEKIRHNAFHRYLVANTLNDLQKEVLSFLDTVKNRFRVFNEGELKLDTGLYFLSTELKSGTVQEGFEEQHYQMEQTQSPKSTQRGGSGPQDWKWCGMR